MGREGTATVPITRRGFLGTLGAGALALSAGAATAPIADPPGGFGRMFPLRPFAEPTEAVVEALLELGRRGGILDAKDDHSQGARDLFLEKYIFGDDTGYRFIVDKDNPSNSHSVAGMTFLAQFIAHDVTFDASSPLGRPADVRASRNARDARLDLESVYGGGPTLAPHLYDGAKLRVESGGIHEDVPRAANGTALVGDVRNDQTVILSGLHAAFLRFHNAVLEQVGTFEQARRETRWHYQWLVLREFLPHAVGEKMLDDVLRNGRRFYRPAAHASIPVEFAAGAFRFGHSMVRPSYRVNFTADRGQPFFAFTFDPRDDGSDAPNDLRGGFRQPRRFVDWSSFFDFRDDRVRRPKKIDSHISTTLFDIPLGAIPTQDGPQSLPQRDLLRHLTWQLPSGQAIAREIGAEALTAQDLKELEPFGVGFERSTPLWYYVLKEAELVEDGARLGPVGGRIVAEVLVGLLEHDAESFLRADPRWTPTFGGSEFRMTDFLTFAGVHPR